MARIAILLAFFLAGACSPSGESEMRAPKPDSGGDAMASLVLTGQRPSAAIGNVRKCAGDLIVEVGEIKAPGDYVLVVTGRFGAERRPIASHTPYPTGSGGRFVIKRDACAEADAIEIEAQPMHGEALPAGLEIPVAISAAATGRE